MNNDNTYYSWTISVKDLGKIKSAEIAVSPMTLFIGDNNSGKSYLMTLIYTLLNIRWFSEGFDLCERTNEYKACKTWIQNKFTETQYDIVKQDITPDIQDMFQALLNKVIRKNINQIAKKGFNSDISIGGITLKLIFHSGRSLNYVKMYSEDRKEFSQSLTFSDNTRKHELYTRATTHSSNIPFLISFILEYLVKADYKTQMLQNACYLPASRTGFLLNYRSLIKSSLEGSYDNSIFRTDKLTRPCSDFLKNLSSISSEHVNRRYEAIIQFIENNMTNGSVRASAETPQASIFYYPKESDKKIPMYLSSGVITEVAPLILMLLYQPFSTLFIEEPEISLHPQLQQVMARVLIQLSNEKLPLFITTHSDIILQQINNMIKLRRLDESKRNALMKKYGYNEKELISEKEISVYQFNSDRNSGRTTVSKLTCGPYGFEVPSFNDALDKLLQQTYHFEEDAE